MTSWMGSLSQTCFNRSGCSGTIHLRNRVCQREEWNMKTRLVFLLVILVTVPSFMSAQEVQQAVSLDVFLPAAALASQAFGEMAWIPLNIKYQRVIADHLVLAATTGLNYSWSSTEKILETSPMLQLGWHPFHAGLEGFHLGPYILFSYCKYWNDHSLVDNPAHSFRFAIGGVFGWQFLLPSRILLDLNAGLGCGVNMEVDRYDTATTEFPLNEIMAGILVGSSF